ncbi:MAG: DNA polymerase III subunit epsilon [Rubrivivax sp.]|nr:DNA polymerase III subunit epsilon [Rubrivivax sp.]
MRQIFLDTETTGLDAASGDRIVEIGCLEMVGRRLSGQQFHHYLNPERSSHPDALRVHGLTDEFLADKPRFAEVADALLKLIEGAEVIIHNATFDVGFLDAELARAGRPPVREVAAKVTDSLLMAREQYPGKANSLDALCRRLEVDNSGRTFHGALLDASLLAEVYIRMTRGQDSLVIDGADGNGSQLALQAVDFSAYGLALVEPTAEELAAHDALLLALDKECKGRAVWKPAPAAEPVAAAVA